MEHPPQPQRVISINPDEIAQKKKMEEFLGPIEALTSMHPQMIEGKLHYVVSGSTALVLFAESENIRLWGLDEEGNLTEINDQPLDEKTNSYLKENISKLGRPSDIDVVTTKSNTTEIIAEDQYEFFGEGRILSGDIGGKEYYFESPLTYVEKVFANLYLKSIGNSDSIPKKYQKLRKIEAVLEALYQDRSINEFVEKIEKIVKSIPNEHWIDDAGVGRERDYAKDIKQSAHSMYSWMTSGMLPQGGTQEDSEASVNINNFPKVKEVIDKIASRNEE